MNKLFFDKGTVLSLAWLAGTVLSKVTRAKLTEASPETLVSEIKKLYSAPASSTTLPVCLHAFVFADSLLDRSLASL